MTDQIEITNTTQLAYPAKCIHCGGVIPAYTEHTRAAGFGGNMPSEWRMHADCFRRWTEEIPLGKDEWLKDRLIRQQQYGAVVEWQAAQRNRDSLPLPDRLAEIEHRIARMEAYFCKCCWSAPHKHGSDLCRDCERQEYADVKSPPDEAGGES